MPQPNNQTATSNAPTIHRHRRTRTQRWQDAVAELIAVQTECDAWLQALPNGLQESVTAEALQAISGISPICRPSSRRVGSAETDGKVRHAPGKRDLSRSLAALCKRGADDEDMAPSSR